MKQRVGSLAALLSLLLCLTACGGGTSAPNEGGAMTEEEYQSRIEELSADIGAAMASMSGLSASDEDSFREGVENMRTMIEPFRNFAAITNPPEDWAEAHAKIAEGCSGFAAALENMCGHAVSLLDAELDPEDYNSAVTEDTAGLTEAAALLTEGVGMMEE